MQNIIVSALPNIKHFSETFYFYFCTTSLELSMYFTFIAHLNVDQPRRALICTCVQSAHF